MLTLGLDTSGAVCAVALLEDDAVLFRAEIAVPRAHGRRLAPLVAQAFEHTGRDLAHLGLVAVAAGPGSFTGLRIGMSTAKGLALSTGADLVGVSTLAALALDAPAGVTVAAVLPSRRGEVYIGAFRDGTEVAAPAALAVDAVATWLPEGATVGGPGADRLDAAWPRTALSASGVAVARIGLRQWAERGADDLASAEPLYLKPVATSQPRAIFGS